MYTFLMIGRGDYLDQVFETQLTASLSVPLYKFNFSWHNRWIKITKCEQLTCYEKVRGRMANTSYHEIARVGPYGYMSTGCYLIAGFKRRPEKTAWKETAIRLANWRQWKERETDWFPDLTKWPDDRLTSHGLNTPESTFKESKIYPHTLSFSTWNMGGWELFFFTLTPDERRTKKWHVKPLQVPSNNMIGFWFKHIMSDNVFKQRAESKLFSKCRRESREPG